MLQFQFGTFPVLHTERLVLRRPDNVDAPGLYNIRSNPEMMKYIGRPLAQHIDEMSAFIQKLNTSFEKEETVTWVITTKEHDLFIGIIGFHRIDREHHRAEVGYMLAPAYHRRGMMFEALTAVLAFGFHHIGLHSVEANIDENNLASANLLKKCGFVQEAHFKENFFFDGRFLDSFIYSLVAPM